MPAALWKNIKEDKNGIRLKSTMIIMKAEGKVSNTAGHQILYCLSLPLGIWDKSCN
jgi:hypothetical protein